jgi:hypothetical protein
MIDLQTMLDGRTHRDLELIARAHKLPFTRRDPKAQGLETLAAALHAGAYQRAFKDLTSDHIAALHALVAGGGWLPLPLFTHYFGEIRPYKPWRVAFTPRHPWRYPASVAERLYHLGFIHVRDDEMVGIVQEARALLPPLPVAEATVTNDVTVPHGRLTLLRDVAALLGVLLLVEAVPVHDRWLSLSVLRQVNDRLTLKADLSAIRSELQTGRLRWLHYLAQVGGLLNVQAGVFKPTVAAWQWLSAPPQVQWDCLMQAVEHDLEADDRLWDVFRLPEVTAHTWRVLRHTLDELDAAQGYRVKDLFPMLAPYLLSDRREDIGYLLRDVFAWSGVLVLARGRVFIQPQRFDPAPAPAVESAAELYFPLPDAPSAALVTLLAFATIEDGSARIDEAALVRAVQNGLTAGDVIGTINALRDTPLSITAQQQIQSWAQAANRLTLKPMVVLYAPDAAIITQLREKWRLAEHFAERLSPHHLAVVAEDAGKLLSRLERRGIHVTSLVRPQSARRVTDMLNGDMAEYLLLAVRTYQKLHVRLDATIRIPQALTHWLAGQVSDPASIEASADVLVRSVQKQVPASSIDAGVQDEASIRRWLTFAHQRRQPLTIDYFSPYSGEHTTRTIDVDEIYDSNDLTYIDAYCHQAEKVLTFRLDRVLRIHAPPPIQDIAV